MTECLIYVPTSDLVAELIRRGRVIEFTGTATISREMMLHPRFPAETHAAYHARYNICGKDEFAREFKRSEKVDDEGNHVFDYRLLVLKKKP